jgi:hypothetical protein
MPCSVCGEPLGGGWALRWKSDHWAHLHCQLGRAAEERALGDNPWLSEESAMRMKLTLSAFGELPSWETKEMRVPYQPTDLHHPMSAE